MKKAVLTLLFLLSMPLAFSITIDNIAVAPKEGSFNIKMDADYYPDRASVIGEGNNNQLDFGSRDGTTTNVTKYNDINIVSIVEFNFSNLKTQSEEIYYTIDVTTSTGLFEFVSQSDSAYSRPFKLYLVASHRGTNGWFNSTTRLGSYEIMNNFADRKRIPSTNTSGRIWFDIILAFPEKSTDWIKDGEILNYGGKTYFLAPLNDYAAYFTVTVSLTDETGSVIDSASASYPCTGYIDANEVLHNDNFSMMITPSAEASNIKIENTGSMQKIANVSLSYGVNKSTAPTGNPVVFISSSSNPFNAKSEQFRFVHSGADGFITSRNSITYKVIATSDDQRITFDGTDFMDESGNVSNKLTLQSMRQDFESDGWFSSFSQSWYNYIGQLHIILDSHPDIMNAGRYESSVYFHIMDVN